MNRLASLTLITACVAPCLPAAAQFAKTEDAIEYRQSAMFIQGQHMGRLGAMASGRAPYDAATAVANAEVVATMSKLPWAGFGAGTEGGQGQAGNLEGTGQVQGTRRQADEPRPTSCWQRRRPETWTRSRRR